MRTLLEFGHYSKQTPRTAGASLDFSAEDEEGEAYMSQLDLPVSLWQSFKARQIEPTIDEVRQSSKRLFFATWEGVVPREVYLNRREGRTDIASLRAPIVEVELEGVTVDYCPADVPTASSSLDPAGAPCFRGGQYYIKFVGEFSAFSLYYGGAFQEVVYVAGHPFPAGWTSLTAKDGVFSNGTLFLAPVSRGFVDLPYFICEVHPLPSTQVVGFLPDDTSIVPQSYCFVDVEGGLVPDRDGFLRPYIPIAVFAHVFDGKLIKWTRFEDPSNAELAAEKGLRIYPVTSMVNGGAREWRKRILWYKDQCPIFAKDPTLECRAFISLAESITKQDLRRRISSIGINTGSGFVQVRDPGGRLSLVMCHLQSVKFDILKRHYLSVLPWSPPYRGHDPVLEAVVFSAHAHLNTCRRRFAEFCGDKSAWVALAYRRPVSSGGAIFEGVGSGSLLPFSPIVLSSEASAYGTWLCLMETIRSGMPLPSFLPRSFVYLGVIDDNLSYFEATCRRLVLQAIQLGITTPGERSDSFVCFVSEEEEFARVVSCRLVVTSRAALDPMSHCFIHGGLDAKMAIMGALDRPESVLF